MELAITLVGVPRLHDIGRSGWIVAGVIGVEILVVVGVALLGGDADAILIAGGIVVFVILALGVWLGTIRGEVTANKWGDPPQPGVQFRSSTSRR